MQANVTHMKHENGNETWQQICPDLIRTESLLHTAFPDRWEVAFVSEIGGHVIGNPRSLSDEEALEVLERFGARHAFQVAEARKELEAARTEHDEARLRVHDAYRRRAAAADALRALGEEV